MKLHFALALLVILPASTGQAAPADCEKLFTAADVKAACGTTVNPAKRHFSENGKGINTCVRNAPIDRVAANGVTFRLGRYPSDARAKGYFNSATKGDPQGGIGDDARYNERSDTSGGYRTLTFRKGSDVVEITNEWMRTGKPICTQEQLIKLAKSILPRL